MPSTQPWEVSIGPFEGLAPGFWKNANTAVGNKGHASDVQDVDMTDPSVLTQGPGLANLTNGTQAAAISTLIKGFTATSIDGTYVYGVGGNKFYQMTSAAVTNASVWPHTIDKATYTAEDGEDAVYYGGYYWYSYNHSATLADVGRYDGNVTFDDDFMSTVPTDNNSLTGGVPHKMLAAGDNRLYITNGRFVANYDGVTLVREALDLPIGEVVVDLAFENNRMYIASNRPNSSSVMAEGSIYVWDMVSSSWEYQIRIPGRIGALKAKNGLVNLWYQDKSSSGLRVAMVEGDRVRDLCYFTGSLPLYYQVFDHENHLAWLSSGEFWMYGSCVNDLPMKLFQYANAGYATAGGVTNAFGSPIVASNATTNYRVAKFSGYAVTAQWKSINLDMSSVNTTSILDKIVVFTEQLSSGARCDVIVTYDFGSSSDSTPSSVEYDAADTAKTRWVIQRGGAPVENIRIDVSWANGSASNPVKIRKILLQGYFVPNE